MVKLINDKISNSNLAIYQTSNDLSENTSVLWLKNLFNRKDIFTEFAEKDKKPDIDGFLTILNDGRFSGRLEVQIKTYNSKESDGQAKYRCDTKLLYYALKNRVNCIILLVVDKEKGKAYWKYLTEKIINSLCLKDKQQKKTIYFEENEYVDCNNVDECIKIWESYWQIKNNGFFIEDVSIEKANEKKTQISEYLTKSDLSSLSDKYIVCIQNFIDRYNNLFDNDYNIIKRFYYPKVWKFGIAIGEFAENSLSFIIYSINKALNDLLLKKVDDFSIFDEFSFDKNYIYAVSHKNKNMILNPEKPDIVMGKIYEKIKDLIENKRFLYLSPEIAIECIYDTIEEEYRNWNIDCDTSVNLLTIKDFITNKYPNQITKKDLQTYTARNSSNNITITYHCIEYLLNNGFDKIDRLYPAKPSNNNREAYSNYLYKKAEVIFSFLPSIFEAYMHYTFPILQSKITFWDNVDLTIVNFRAFDDGSYAIEINDFINQKKDSSCPELIFTKNFEHEIYKEYFKESTKNKDLDIFKYSFFYKSNKYWLVCRKFEDIRCIDNYFSIHKQLYRFLAERFDKYLQPDCRIMNDIAQLDI